MASLLSTVSGDGELGPDSGGESIKEMNRTVLLLPCCHW